MANTTLLNRYPSHAYRCLDGTDVYHVYHGSIEFMISHTKDDRWYGDYINHDGWFDFTEEEAKLAAQAYGCMDIPLHDYRGVGKVTIIDFTPFNIDRTMFEKVFLYDYQSSI